MPKTVTITLREAIIGHGKPITELVLRPPTLPEYMAIGEPWSAMPGAQGADSAIVENDAAIAGYAEACITEPRDKLLLNQVQLADAMEVKEAILGFFVEARLAKLSPTSPTPSSSTSN